MSNASAISRSRLAQGLLLFVAWFVFTIPLTAQENNDTKTLELGRPIERTLAGDQAHAYRIALTAGQYVNIVVDQRGIDVVLRLLGPNGNRLAEVDSPNGIQGPEALSLICESSGNYSVEVRSLEKTAVPGGYEISLRELRAAVPNDQKRLTAKRLYQEGEQLSREPKKESLTAALEKFGEALPLFQALSDRSDEADALSYMGSLYTMLGEPVKARDYFVRALPIYRSAGDRRGEARTLNNIGGTYAESGDQQQTLNYYQQALPIYREIGDREGEATALSNISASYSKLGETQKTLDYLRQALPIVRAIGNRDGEARTLNNIGAVYKSLGETQKALDYWLDTLAILRSIGQSRSEGVALNNIGTAYTELGDPQKAFEYYRQALTISRATGDRGGEAVTLSNIGSLLGSQPKALDFYSEALRLQRAIGDRYHEATTLGAMGSRYLNLGETEKARAYLEQALTLHHAIGDRGGEAFTLFYIAYLENDNGNLEEALRNIEQALSITESLRAGIANNSLRSSYFATVQNYYQLYSDVLMRLHKQQSQAGYDGKALQVSERGRARSLLELLVESGAKIREGVDSRLSDREGALRQQLNAAAQRQLALLSGPHADTEATAIIRDIEKLTTALEQVEREIKTTSPRYAALTQPQPLSLQEIQTQVLDPETVLLEYSLGDKRSYLWAVTPTSIKSYELPKREEIEAAARQVYGLLNASNESIENETKSQQQARIANADAEYPRAAAVLAKLILAPVARELGHKRLVIVADGALQYIPFGALPSPQNQTSGYHPIVIDHEIISLPSASTLAVLRREVKDRKPGAKAVAVLADPVFESDDERVTSSSTPAGPAPTRATRRELPRGLERAAKESGLRGASFKIPRLPGTREEAKHILALTPAAESKMAMDFAASRQTATSSDLSQYRYVHFATHGFLDSVHPELSGIVLSMVDEKGNPQDGFLRSHEVFNLKLPAELVVLSACQTGLGKEVRGEGLVGLTRGFMYAGAPRVVVSLWSVDDESTAELMTRFYRGMLKDKLRPAAALRAAQVSLMKEKDWQSPYYWAAFTLQGEWR